MRIQESAEMYLETILALSESGSSPRAIDIATELGYSRASVSVALKGLREDGYLDVSDDNLLHLTDKGRAIATKIYERHKILTDVFIRLGVSEQTAREDACRVEHYISDETFDAIKAHGAKAANQR